MEEAEMVLAWIGPSTMGRMRIRATDGGDRSEQWAAVDISGLSEA